MDVTWTRGSPHWMGRGLQVQARVQAEAGHQDGEHTDKTWPSSLCLGCAGRVLAPAWCPACAPPRPWLWPDTLAPWADVDNGLWTMSLWPEAVTARRTRLPVAPGGWPAAHAGQVARGGRSPDGLADQPPPASAQGSREPGETLPRKLKQVLRHEFWASFENLLRQGAEVG